MNQTLNNYKLTKNRTTMENTVPEIIVDYKKIDKGYVAQCPENLQFVVQTTSKSKIKVEIKEMIEDYVKIFPRERKEILPHGNNFRVVLNKK